MRLSVTSIHNSRASDNVVWNETGNILIYESDGSPFYYLPEYLINEKFFTIHVIKGTYSWINIEVEVNFEKLRKYLCKGKPIPARGFITPRLESLSLRHSTDNDVIFNKLVNNTVRYIDTKFVVPYINYKLYVYQRENVRWMKELEDNIEQLSIEYDNSKLLEINNASMKEPLFFDAHNQRFLLEKNPNMQSVKFNGGFLMDQVGLGKTICGIGLCMLNPRTDAHIFRKLNRKDEKVSSKDKETLIRSRCPAILKSGKRKGEECNATIVSGMYCKKHTIEDDSDEEDSRNIPKLKLQKLITDNYMLKSRATLIICPNQVCDQWRREILKAVNKKVNIQIITTKPQLEKITYADLVVPDFVITSFNFLANPFFLSLLTPYKVSGHFHHECFKNARSELIECPSKNNIKKSKLLQTKAPILPLIHWHRIILDEMQDYNDDYTQQNVLTSFDTNYKWCLSGTNSLNCVQKVFQFLTGQERSLLYKKEILNYMKNTIVRRNTTESTKEHKFTTISEENIWLTLSVTEKAMYDTHVSVHGSNWSDEYLRQICCHPNISDETKKILENCKTIEDIHKCMIKHHTDRVKMYETYIESYKNTINNNRLLLSSESNAEEQVRINRNIKFYTDKIKSTEQQLSQAKSASEYFNNLLPSIKEGNLDDCCICMCTIENDNLGLTKCGHVYCYTCLAELVKSNGMCAMCREKLTMLDVYEIKDRDEIEKLKNIRQEQGTKMTAIINYIKNNPDDRIIIFSQWDNLLKKVEQTLKDANIKLVSCRGSIISKTKAIREFTTDPSIKIITLSSVYSSSGVSLTEANKIIFFEPIYNTDFSEVTKTENQAIGRTNRLGQKKPIQIIRFLTKDTIEEQMMNQIRDNKD